MDGETYEGTKYEGFRKDNGITEHAGVVRQGYTSQGGYHQPMFYFALSWVQDAAIRVASQNGGQYWPVLALTRRCGLPDSQSRLDDKKTSVAQEQIKDKTKAQIDIVLLKYVGVRQPLKQNEK